MKKVASLLGIAILGGVVSLGGYKMLFDKSPIVIEKSVQPTLTTVKTNYRSNNALASAATIDFTTAAAKTVHAVVHVKNTAIRTQSDPMDFFFGNGNGVRKYKQVGIGSGVIITADGYIVTNNHVIAGASELEVTLNNQKKYKAKIIGTDTENDIALLKIDTKEKLPYIPFGDSDVVKVGEWVLAVGNPYNLTSTVTAGIVSAKGRNLQGNSTNVNSFIQTDAAVNPGNSGGALVNTRGELIGINTAITSRTGSFIGYSFAVPSNIAKKVIEDLMEYGKVRNVEIGITANLKNENIDGVEIEAITENGAAQKAGLKTGDIIVKINRVAITKFADLTGQLRAKRPGDSVEVTVKRNGEELTKTVALKKKVTFASKKYGLQFRNLTKKELKKLGIANGVQIIKSNSSEEQGANLNGFIITKINHKKVSNASEVVHLLDGNNRYSIAIEMINTHGEKVSYMFR